VVGASVAHAFGDVQNKIETTRGKLGAASKEAKTFQRALDLRARRDDLSAKLKASGGTDSALRKELTKVAAEYRKAKTAAMGYGASVSQWAARQKAARAELERSARQVKIFSALQEEKEKRAKLRGSIMGTTAAVMSLAMPVKAAIEWESGMADVAKTLDGARDDAGNLTQKYYEIEKVIRDMAKTTPMAMGDLPWCPFLRSPSTLNNQRAGKLLWGRK
jgi:phage-related tail protein